MRSRQSTSSRRPRSRPVEKTGRIKTGSNLFWELASLSPTHTDRLGRAIGHALQGGETLALFGELGAGKTALVRGIASGLGAPRTAVSSPTFVFIHEYRGRLPFAHIDLYRVHSTQEALSTGLEEYLVGSTVTAIEWADKGLTLLPDDRLDIHLRHESVERRTIQLSASGTASALLLAEAKRRYARSQNGASHKRIARPKPKRNAPS